MLTVKLQRGGRLHIAECVSVSVDKPSLDLTVITAHRQGGEDLQFSIVKQGSVRDRLMAEEKEDFYHVAFVETAAGSTTQIIRAGT